MPPWDPVAATETTETTGPPADEDLTTYPVRINGEDIEVEI